MIKNFLFDFGNVIFNIDIPGAERELLKFISKSNLDCDDSKIENLIELFETGKLSTRDFLRGFQSLSDPGVDQSAIADAWNSMLVDLPRYRLDFLLKLRHTHKVYLLSNNNPLHYEAIMKYLTNELDISDFNSRYFDKTYYSHLIGKRKPDHEAFKTVVRDASIRPEETLFIDDLVQNCQSALDLGFRICHLQPGEEVVQRIEDFLMEQM